MLMTLPFLKMQPLSPLSILKKQLRQQLKCQQMASEAIQGEEKLTDSEQKSLSLRVILGLEKSENQLRAKGLDKDSDQQKKGDKSRKNTKPFKRNPKRDPVGGEFTHEK